MGFPIGSGPHGNSNRTDCSTADSGSLNETYIPFSQTSKPALVGFVLLLCGLIVWTVFLIFDRNLDSQTAAGSIEKQ